MMKIFRGIIILLWLSTLSNADNNQSTQNDLIYIDKLHKSISETIIEWSDILDTKLSNWLGDDETNTTDLEENITGVEENRTKFETNTTGIIYSRTMPEANITDLEDNGTTVPIDTPAIKTKRTIVPTDTRSEKTHTTTQQDNTELNATNTPSNTLEEKVHSVDQFFQNEKYLNETKNTYIRVRIESYLQSKDSNDFDLKVRAQMPFSKSKKRFRIFIDDLTLDNADEILKDTSQDDDATPDIGLHYFASRHKILSRYSVGLSGIDPFVRARYNMPMHIGKWLIDPVQLFRYSIDDKFEEETNIYFDRKIGEKSLLRIQLHRSTQEEVDGMNYSLSAQYYRSTKKDTGFGFGQTFIGNTEEYISKEGVPHEYSGIYDYVTSATWRENIWREWFYYEVRPSVSFHKQYDYKPNYRVRFFLDFYFGKFN